MTTIHDVARRAGVSPVTVSRVINGAENVNTGTRDKVEQAIRELGYLPNLAARSLRSRQTSTLALILPDVTNAFWTTVARGVEDAAQSKGYSVLLCNSDENPAKQKAYINAVLQQRVDGVVIAPYDTDAHNLQPLRELKTPAVILDRRVVGWDVDTVCSDSISGAYALVQHLTGLGHRTIAMISGPPGTSTADERVAGYYLAMQDAGIPIDERLVRRGEYRARSGRQMTEQIFDQALHPTAVVAANNVIGMGVIEALYARGMRIPQDVAMVCFDDLPDLARFYPFLTVVMQPAYDMGINAAQLLLSRLDAQSPIPPRHVVLPSRLVMRYSCGRLLNQSGAEQMNLVPLTDPAETVLIKPLPTERLQTLEHVGNLKLAWMHQGDHNTSRDRPSADRLRKALNFKSVDRLPFVEMRPPSKAVAEYILERSLPHSEAELESGRQMLSPVEMVEFAQRAGIDAVPCEINWLPGLVRTAQGIDLAAAVRRDFPPPSLTEHFNRLESFLRAAQGTQVRVFPSFSGFFYPALSAAGVASPSHAFENGGGSLNRLMDMILEQQEKLMRALCDRFSGELPLVLVRDRLFDWPEVTPRAELFQSIILPRLARLASPGVEHGLTVGISTPGMTEAAVSVLCEVGFGLFHAIPLDWNHSSELRARWQGKAVLSVSGEGAQGEKVGSVTLLADGGGFLFHLFDEETASYNPGQWMAQARAIQRAGQKDA